MSEGKRVVRQYLTEFRPTTNTKATQLYFDDFATSLPKNVIALVVLNGATRHRSPKLAVPDNPQLIFLSPYTLELNSTEHLVLDETVPPGPVR